MKRWLAFAFSLAGGIVAIAAVVKLIPPMLDYFRRSPSLEFLAAETETGLLQFQINNPTASRINVRLLAVGGDTQLLSHLRFNQPTIIEGRPIPPAGNASMKLAFASIIGSPVFRRDENAFFSQHEMDKIEFLALAMTDDGEETRVRCTVPLKDLRVYLSRHTTTDKW